MSIATKAVYPIVIIVLLSVGLFGLLIGDARRESKGREITDQAIKTAEEWKATAEQWEQVAKRYERLANRCLENVEGASK